VNIIVKKTVLATLVAVFSLSLVFAYHALLIPKGTKKKKKSSVKVTKVATPKLEKATYLGQINTSGDTLAWVNAQMALLSDTQLIGQLFMLPAWSNADSFKNALLPGLITRYNIGGLIFMQGTPVSQALICNRYQSMATTPMLISIDGEWGLNMRLDGTTCFPHQLTLGAIQDENLIFKMGQDIGRQCKRLGIHVNFAPVVDINNNPNNPVINDRSFGEDANNVISKSLAYMKGMQSQGILACAKHFPGHGDTEVDSHKDLPSLPFDRKRFDEVELKPFIALQKNNVASMMVGHLAVPLLEPDTKVPATLSQKIVTDLLRNELHFDGLLFTDALNMKGVTKNYTPGMVDLKALLAGNDILLFSEDVPKAVNAIFYALDHNLITKAQIKARVAKQLYYKYKAGLAVNKYIAIENLNQDLNTIETNKLNVSLYEAAITALSPHLPNVYQNKTLIITINSDTATLLAKQLQSLGGATLLVMGKNTIPTMLKVADSLNIFEEVIIDLHGMSRFASRNYGISLEEKQFIQQLSKTKSTTLLLFGNPYSLKNFDQIPAIVAYEDNAYSQQAMANVLLGYSSCNGLLPITGNAQYAFKMGNAYTASVKRKVKTEPLFEYEKLGFTKNQFLRIDSIAQLGILQKAYPSCVIAVYKDGQLIYNKAYGTSTYASTTAVKPTTLYDLASITKIAATTLVCMKLYEDGLLDLNQTIGYYLPEAKKTNKKKITVKSLLLHEAGLVPYIPFYKACITKDNTLNNNFTTIANEDLCMPVAENLYINKKYEEEIWKTIYKSEIKNAGAYKYSDLDLYFMKRIAEKLLNGQTMESYLEEQYYTPMQLRSTCFNPLQHGISKQNIAPTEQDNYFRNQLICGYVHDQGASMCGGVAGHAGLFSTAQELGLIMQMLNNGGTLNNKRYLKESTVALFTSRQSTVSRRGLGFDKQDANPLNASPTCKSASPKTFGHSGFTGTITWADPTYNLVYVFLSNRVCPEADNNKIIQLGIRTNIQEILYENLKK
jgi:beta-N-acetylhexosaminidase